MTRIVEFLVALNAIGGVLTFLGIRWGVRRVRGKVSRGGGGELEPTDKEE